jgi:hypothetical protein
MPLSGLAPLLAEPGPSQSTVAGQMPGLGLIGAQTLPQECVSCLSQQLQKAHGLASTCDDGQTKAHRHRQSACPRH